MKDERITNRTVTMDTLIQKANDIQADCADYTVRDIASNMFMSNNAELNFFDDFCGWQRMKMSEWSLEQASTKLGIPRSYLNSCITAGMPDLAATNFNHWLHKKEKGTAVIRTYQDSVRAILSHLYAKYDSPSILEAIADNLPELYWNIKGSFLNEERLHLRFVNKNEMTKVNDGIFPAIFVDSSDVGRCAIHVRFGLYRLVCTNGLTVEAIPGMRFHQRHIGIRASELGTILREQLALLPDFIAHAEDMIAYAESRSINLQDPDMALQVLHDLKIKAKLSEKDAKNVLEFAKENYQPTRWGLVNALTEFAQTKSLEGRLEMERGAGLLLAAA